MPRQISRTVAIALLAAASVAAPAGAVELRLASETASETGVIDDDYLFLGETLAFDAAVESLFFLGKTLTLDSAASGIVVAAGETLTVNGSTRGEAFLAGRTVTVTGILADTTFIAAEDIVVAADSRIEEALFIAADHASIAGSLGDDLYAVGDAVFIAGVIAGDVEVRARRLRIAEGADVRGDLRFHSRNELSDAEIARVRGTVTQVEPDRSTYRPPLILRAAPWLLQIIVLLSGLVFALLMYTFPGLRRTDTDRGTRRFWLTVAWGLIPFFGFPFLIIALFLAGIVFGITVPIGLSLVFSLSLLSYVLGALAMPQIGAYVRRIATSRSPEEAGGAAPDSARRSEGGPWRDVFLGFPVVFVLALVPFVNAVAFVGILSLGWGLVIERLFAVRLGAGPG